MDFKKEIEHRISFFKDKRLLVEKDMVEAEKQASELRGKMLSLDNIISELGLILDMSKPNNKVKPDAKQKARNNNAEMDIRTVISQIPKDMIFRNRYIMNLLSQNNKTVGSSTLGDVLNKMVGEGILLFVSKGKYQVIP